MKLGEYDAAVTDYYKIKELDPSKKKTVIFLLKKNRPKRKQSDKKCPNGVRKGQTQGLLQDPRG